MKKYNETLLIPRIKGTRNIIIIHLWKSIMNNVMCTFIRKILRKKKKYQEMFQRNNEAKNNLKPC